MFDYSWEDIAKVRNMKQYLLAMLHNAPGTIKNYYAGQYKGQSR